MRCGVTGSGGQLGRCLVARLEAAPKHTLAFATGHADCDLGRADHVDALFDDGPAAGADVVFNAAAYTAVDRCEQEEPLAHDINADGVAHLARRCQESGTLLVHVSTDYVFAGDARAPYAEGDATAPVNAYGRTKRAGEQAALEAAPDALVVRTSWVFGPGRNFVVAILEQARKRRSGELEGPLSVVDDQVGAPTYADHLAQGLIGLAELARPAPGDKATPKPDEPVRGLYHLTGGGSTTWWGFARRILDRTGHADLAIDRAATAGLDLPAARPAYSVLDTRRAAGLGVALPAWEQGLDDYLASHDGAALLEARA